MLCRECETDNVIGAESCVGCGKVLAIALDTADESAPPREFSYSQLETKSIGSVTPYADSAQCSLCNGACEQSSLVTVRDAVFCPECAPLVRAGSREDAVEEAPQREPGGYIPTAAGPVIPPREPMLPPTGPGSAVYGPTGPGASRAESMDSPFDDGLDRTVTIRPGASYPMPPSGPVPSAAPLPPPTPHGPPPATVPPTLGPQFDQPPSARPSRRPIHPVKDKRGVLLPLFAMLLVLGVGAFLVWHFVLGRDRIDRLLAEASKTDRTVTLAPRFDKGDSWRYRVDAKVHFDITTSGFNAGNQTGSITLGANTEYYLDVLDVDAAGNTELQIAVNSFDFDVIDSEGDVEDVQDLRNLGPMDQFFGPGGGDDLDSHTVQFRVDARGRPAGAASGDMGLGTVIMGILTTVRGMLVDRAMEPGDTWEHEQDMGDGETLLLRMKLTGFAKHLGRECAVISVEAEKSVQESLPMGPGAFGSLGMNLELRGALFLDAEQGHMVHLATDAKVDVTMTAGPDSGTLDAWMELDLELQ